MTFHGNIRPSLLLVAAALLVGCGGSDVTSRSKTAYPFTVYAWSYIDAGHPNKGIFITFSDESTWGRRKTKLVRRGGLVGLYRLERLDLRAELWGDLDGDYANPLVTYFTFTRKDTGETIILWDGGDGVLRPGKSPNKALQRTPSASLSFGSLGVARAPHER